MPSKGVLCKANLYSDLTFGTANEVGEFSSLEESECRSIFVTLYVYVCKIGDKFGGCSWSFSWLGKSNPIVWYLHCVCDC